MPSIPKLGKLSLQDIKYRSKGYFFSKDTMRFFQGDKYRAVFSDLTGQNYVVSKNPAGLLNFWEFNAKTGTMRPLLLKTEKPEYKIPGDVIEKMKRAGWVK